MTGSTGRAETAGHRGSGGISAACYAALKPYSMAVALVPTSPLLTATGIRSVSPDDMKDRRSVTVRSICPDGPTAGCSLCTVRPPAVS